MTLRILEKNIFTRLVTKNVNSGLILSISKMRKRPPPTNKQHNRISHADGKGNGHSPHRHDYRARRETEDDIWFYRGTVDSKSSVSDYKVGCGC